MQPEADINLCEIEYLLQAISKVKNAIHGYQNVRFNDLENMLQFTHTGDLGKTFKN